MTTIYRVRSHMKQSTPDGREEVFSGTPEECDEYYCDLPHMAVIEDRYLFAEDDEDCDDAVDWEDWEHAGCSEA